MSRQYYDEVLRPIMDASQTATTGVAENALWPTAPWTALAANQVEAGQYYRCRAGGVMTTGATPGTLIVTPRWGTSTAGTALGASATSGTLAASITNAAWTLDCTLQIRSKGAAGAAILKGVFECSRLLTAAPIGQLNFGLESATPTAIDTTVAAGLFVAVTMSNAGTTGITQMLTFECLN